MTMRRAVLVCAGALALAAGAVPAGAVSGGHKASIANEPYVAWLPSGCTGTLIAPDRVLTAGHCLDGFTPVGFSVLVGKDGNALIGSGSNRFETALANGGTPALGFAVDPNFRESFPFAKKRLANAIALDDVGLILLARPVTGIDPVRLPAAGDHTNEKVGAKGSIFGYGLKSNSLSSLPKSLLTGSMSVISQAACRRAYPHAILASELCAQDVTHKRAPLVQACAGDSGGPLIHQTALGPVQIGITSWGPEVKDAPCGRRHLPGVYMRTSSFASFINDPSPVISPYVADPEHDFVRVTGAPKVGATLTCNAPRFGGSPSTLSYKWIFNFKTISRKQTVTAIKAMAGHSVGCNVTAHNASGSFEESSPRIGRLIIDK
jgi:secreted trypsin-like serine protease